MLFRSNGKDLIEVEKIKERCKEHTEELYKKDLNDRDNPDCVVSHSEPDILEPPPPAIELWQGLLHVKQLAHGQPLLLFGYGCIYVVPVFLSYLLFLTVLQPP